MVLNKGKCLPLWAKMFAIFINLRHTIRNIIKVRFQICQNEGQNQGHIVGPKLWILVVRHPMFENLPKKKYLKFLFTTKQV